MNKTAGCEKSHLGVPLPNSSNAGSDGREICDDGPPPLSRALAVFRLEERQEHKAGKENVSRGTRPQEPLRATGTHKRFVLCY